MSEQADDLPDFQARRPWVTGDLQTLRNFVLRPRVDLTPWPHRRLWLPVAYVDHLAAALHGVERLGDAPLVVLVHGLSGCEDSIYLRTSARFWLSLGYPVLRLNLRGSQPSRPYCRGHYHGGRSEDLHDALRAFLARDGRAARHGLIAVGYSLGGNMLIKLLAENGRELPLRAAASVSAPIDLARTSERFHQPRNAVYQRWLLTLLKREATAPPAELSARERRAIAEARTVREFDDRFIAPRFGFDGAAGYYRDCSGLRFLPGVELPLLALHADDDPWIPEEPYRQADALGNPNVRVRLTQGGGHVGFHAADHPQPWHDRAVHAFVHEVG
jgi:hypothetical protein